MKNHKTGFTLVEIMVVVLIVSLLLSIAAVEGIRIRRMANEVTAQGNLKAIATSFEIYAASHEGKYANGSMANCHVPSATTVRAAEKSSLNGLTMPLRIRRSSKP